MSYRSDWANSITVYSLSVFIFSRLSLGYIRVGTPVPHFLLLKFLGNLLSKVCFSCSMSSVSKYELGLDSWVVRGGITEGAVLYVEMGLSLGVGFLLLMRPFHVRKGMFYWYVWYIFQNSCWFCMCRWLQICWCWRWEGVFWHVVVVFIRFDYDRCVLWAIGDRNFHYFPGWVVAAI